MRVNWLEPDATCRLLSALFETVDCAGAQLETAIVLKVSTQGPPRSAPGEAPHIDTGQLVGSFSHETQGVDAIVVARVSTDCPHAAPLEEGTANMAARPHIVSTLIEESDSLARTICTT